MASKHHQYHQGMNVLRVADIIVRLFEFSFLRQFKSPPRNGSGILNDGFLYSHVLGPIGTQSTTHEFGAVGQQLTPSSSPPSNSSSGSVHGVGLPYGMVKLFQIFLNPISTDFCRFSQICGRCEMHATNRCLDCNDVLCENCLLKHQAHLPFQEHCVVLLSNLSPIGSSTSIANGSPIQNEPQCDIHSEVLRYVRLMFSESSSANYRLISDTSARNAIKLFARNVRYGIIKSIRVCQWLCMPKQQKSKFMRP